MIPEPLKCLTHAPPFAKLREHELDGLTDPPVGMKTDLADSVNRGLFGVKLTYNALCADVASGNFER